MIEDGTFSVDDGVEGLREQLDGWRRVYGGPGTRVPESFWAAALEIARIVGPEEFARAMKLTTKAVRSRLDAHGHGESRRARGRARAPAAPKRAAFIEMPSLTAPPSSSSGCTVEVAAPSGARLALRFDDARSIDFRSLLHAVMEGVG